MTSSRRPDNWIVPGGGVEPEEEPSVTAMREVLEEAGVIGKLGRCLGVFEVSCHHTLETGFYRTIEYICLTQQKMSVFARHDNNKYGMRLLLFVSKETQRRYFILMLNLVF